MGYYIETDSNLNKADYIIKHHGAYEVDQTAAKRVLRDMPTTAAVIVVVENGMFEAAGFAFDMREFDAMTLPHDKRPKRFLVLTREQAVKLTGFKEKS